MTDQDLAYLAGFLDGEGCFTTTSSSIVIKSSNTSLPVLNWIRETFGGSISLHSKRHQKQAYQWSINGANAERLCRKLHPYLREKKAQAALLLLFHTTVGPRGRRVSQEDRAFRDDIRKELRLDKSRTY